MFELVDTTFDQVTCAIDSLVVSALARSFAGRNDRYGLHLSYEIDQPLSVVGAVCQNLAAALSGNELSGCQDIVSLSRGQEQADGPAGTLDGQIDLRTQAAARAPERLILSPLFAPAAC